MSVEEIEKAIAELSPEERVAFDRWYWEYAEVQKGFDDVRAGRVRALTASTQKGIRSQMHTRAAELRRASTGG